MNTTASKVNVPLILLWVAALALIGGGYWLLSSSTAAQIEFYTSGSQDVAGLLGAQSNTTIAGLLLAVGALAVVIALAVHALAHVSARSASAEVAAAFAAEDAAFEAEVARADAEADAELARADATADAAVAPVAEAPAVVEEEIVAEEASAAADKASDQK
ncbi:hypothetical protein BJY17_002505 [Agromyces hippuratus]|uniref:Uncharacterized protein n=1 Tax=Agromyces hippuratus TaxID=286438 RepID=A0A852WW25_9MICO|nr:hypothetical protein [Agromyces hippuratus]NYG21758.1 hypothetical protein [Agromyces hippuratus]